MKPEMAPNRQGHRYALVFLCQLQFHATGKKKPRKWADLALLFLASSRCVLVCFQLFQLECSCERANASAEVRVTEFACSLSFVRQMAPEVRAPGAEESTLAGMYILFSGIYSCIKTDQDLFPLLVFHIVIYYCVYL